MPPVRYFVSLKCLIGGLIFGYTHNAKKTGGLTKGYLHYESNQVYASVMAANRHKPQFRHNILQ